ncbi:hypothetical protein Q5752_004645 [Cryptotrichosporon argae]
MSYNARHGDSPATAEDALSGPCLSAENVASLGEGTGGVNENSTSWDTETIVVAPPATMDAYRVGQHGMFAAALADAFDAARNRTFDGKLNFNDGTVSHTSTIDFTMPPDVFDSPTVRAVSRPKRPPTDGNVEADVQQYTLEDPVFCFPRSLLASAIDAMSNGNGSDEQSCPTTDAPVTSGAARPTMKYLKIRPRIEVTPTFSVARRQPQAAE